MNNLEEFKIDDFEDSEMDEDREESEKLLDGYFEYCDRQEIETSSYVSYYLRDMGVKIEY